MRFRWAALQSWLLCLALVAPSAAQYKYYNSSLEIDFPRAGEAARITLIFAPYRQTIVAGTVIPLALKDFTKCNSDCVETVQVVGTQFANSAQWTESTSTLLLTTSSNLVGDRKVQVVIPLEEGIRLPQVGLDPFSREFTLCPAATDCDINSIPAVGSFIHPTIQTELRYSQVPPAYAPSQAGRITEVLTIRFWNNMRILTGEKVVVTLLDFTADEFIGFPVIDSNFEWSASWSRQTYELTFVYKGAAPIDARSNLFTIQNKMAVASNGVAQNDPNLLISTDARNGPVLPTAITKSPFVLGLIRTSELTFVKRRCVFNGFQWVCLKSLAQAGDSAEIRFAFSFSIFLSKDETVTLHLPDCSGLDRSNFPVTDGSGFGADPLGQSLRETHPYSCNTEAICAALSYTGTGYFR